MITKTTSRTMTKEDDDVSLTVGIREDLVVIESVTSNGSMVKMLFSPEYARLVSLQLNQCADYLDPLKQTKE